MQCASRPSFTAPHRRLVALLVLPCGVAVTAQWFGLKPSVVYCRSFILLKPLASLAATSPQHLLEFAVEDDHV